MCQAVYVTKPGDCLRANTIGELGALLGVRPRIARGYRHVQRLPPDERDECCLCCVSLHKTAWRAGMRMYHSGPMTVDLVSR